MRRTQSHVAGFKDRAKKPQNKKCVQSQEAGNGKETDFPLEPPGKNAALPVP